jgi:hypothetical protein
MGIDIFMNPNYIENERLGDVGYSDEAPAFSINSGHQGYLREAYHGGPYATEVLVPEAFAWSQWLGECPADDWPDDLDRALMAGSPIRAAVMRERLPATKDTYYERLGKVYPDTTRTEADDTWERSFVAFVELAERIEAITGEAVQVYASY